MRIFVIFEVIEDRCAEAEMKIRSVPRGEKDKHATFAMLQNPGAQDGKNPWISEYVKQVNGWHNPCTLFKRSNFLFPERRRRKMTGGESS